MSHKMLPPQHSPGLWILTFIFNIAYSCCFIWMKLLHLTTLQSLQIYPIGLDAMPHLTLPIYPTRLYAVASTNPTDLPNRIVRSCHIQPYRSTQQDCTQLPHLTLQIYPTGLYAVASSNPTDLPNRTVCSCHI